MFEQFGTITKEEEVKFPGIVGLFMKNPDTAKPLQELAQVLLVKDTPALPRWKRELIAAAVSKENKCEFCFKSHFAVVVALIGEEIAKEKLDELSSMTGQTPLAITGGLVKLHTLGNYDANILLRMMLLHLELSEEDIHDLILIVAAFNMYNRYVSGSGVSTPSISEEEYMKIGIRIAENGYVREPNKSEVV
jgi:alkylhydroperoxidase family enzyme